MKKYIARYALIGLFLLFATNLWAVPPSSSFTYLTGSIISPSEVQQNETNLYNYLSTGVDTYADSTIVSADITDGTIVNADISGSAAITYGKLSLGSSLLTGDITDGTIVNADISSSAAIDKSKVALSGVVLPSGALFYMITGSCPAGTTDVTSTYSGKFVRFNATQGSTGGADTVTISEANLPSHTHAAGTLAVDSESAHTHAALGSAAAGTGAGFANSTATSTSVTTQAGSAHGHTISGSAGATGSGTATTITNPYVTAKACQVD